MTLRRWPRRWVRPEAGDTLIEVLVAVVIMGIAFVIIVGGIATAIMGSDLQKQQAGADLALRTAAERISEELAYQPCATTYSPSSGPIPGFKLTVTVSYWARNENKFESSLPSCPAEDDGLQMIKLEATSNSGRAPSPATLNIVKRRP